MATVARGEREREREERSEISWFSGWSAALGIFRGLVGALLRIRVGLDYYRYFG